MTIEMIPLHKLRPSKENPRKSFDENSIEGLARSILADGLLQNLVCAKPAKGKRKYDIISGERRYRALSMLAAQGHFPKDLAVPCEIRDGLTQQDTLRIATIENVQRKDLTPLEEAQAIASLVHSGDGMADIVSKTGLSESTIRRRMALLNLSDSARAALAAGEITAAQAEALSIAGHGDQDGILGQIKDGWYSSPAEIKDRLINELPSAAMAIFDRKDYSGDYTTDLFGDDETTYFNDAEQFYHLQKAAAEKLAAELDTQHDWAAFIEGRFNAVEYEKAGKGESGGVAVCLSPEGRVEVHKGLVKHDIDASVSGALKSPPRSSYAKNVREYIAMHKSAAVQAALIGNPRKAREAGVARMLYLSRTHDCLAYLHRLDEHSAALAAINEEAQALYTMLGRERAFRSYHDLLRCAHSFERAYELVQGLDDGQLERLFAFLSAIGFGQESAFELDTRERTIFNRVAADLGVDMRRYWMPTPWFLSRRTMAQLQAIIRESGLNRLFGNGAGFKKAELVRMMAGYFKKVRSFKKPKPDQQRAKDWLPEAMNFPAIDPDAQAQTPEDEDLAKAA